MKRVLIIQPTIPHYRVPFYNAIERLKPSEWEFSVTFDPSELNEPRFQQNPLNADMFRFPTLEVSHLALQYGSHRIEYQTVFRSASRFDLIVAEHALRDLSYLVTPLHRFRGAKFAYWGHGRDRAHLHPTGAKAATEHLKAWLARRMDGYFAYTGAVRDDVVAMGCRPDRVFVLNNTVDIEEQRRVFEAVRPRREAIRRELGVADGPVLLFVGRFTPNKRLDFLVESFRDLRKTIPSAHLLLVGDGPAAPPEAEHVDRFGSIESMDELAPIYAASDVFVFPGDVGLGPLQALCHDLPVITLESPTHNPEVEYLTALNSVMLPQETSSSEYSDCIRTLLNDTPQLENLRRGTWPSIEHLTIDAMARNFISGVNALLGLS